MRLTKNLQGDFYGRPFETQAILLISMMGIFRVAVALLLDLMRPVLNYTELFTDFAFLLLFIGLFLLAVKNTFRRVHPVFGFLFITLLAVNYVQFGGFSGTSKFNFFSGLFIVVLFYTGRVLHVMLVYAFGMLAALTYLSFHGHEWVALLTLPVTTTAADFIFSLLSLSVMAFYLKDIIEREIAKNGELNDQLRRKVNEAKALNAELIAQAIALKGAQRHLGDEVFKRSQSLEVQQEAIETYIHINTKVLGKPIGELSRQIVAVNGGHPELVQLLGRSSAELNEVYGSIKGTLEKKEELDRSKIWSSDDETWV